MLITGYTTKMIQHSELGPLVCFQLLIVPMWDRPTPSLLGQPLLEWGTMDQTFYQQQSAILIQLQRTL